MNFNNKENERIELPDGRVIWLSRSVAIVCHVWCKIGNTYKLLIGQRGEGCPDEVGRWNLPCGYLDWNETLKEACFREIFEETGLDMSKQEIVYDNDMPFLITDIAKGEKQNISHHFGFIIECDKLPLLKNSFSELNEVSKLAWVKYEDTENFDFAFNHEVRLKQFYNKEIK